MAIFEEWATTFYEWGLLDVIFPFLIIFTILFALLTVTKILGEEKEARKKYATVIALAISAITVIPHIVFPSSNGRLNMFGGQFPDVVHVINTALPNVMIWIVGVIIVFMLVSMLNPQATTLPAGEGLAKFVAFLSFGAVLFFFLLRAGYIPSTNYLQRFFSSENVAAFIVLGVFSFIVYYVVKGEKTTPDEPGSWPSFWTGRKE